MQILARSNLLSFLTGSDMDPDGLIKEEMSAIAVAVEADLPDWVEYLVYTDNENGDDPVVQWPDWSPVLIKSVIELTYNSAGDSYYGCVVSHHDYDQARRVYNCYLGGSPLNSAPGFVLCTAVMA